MKNFVSVLTVLVVMMFATSALAFDVKGKTIENTVRLMANVESVSDSTAPRSIVVNEGTLDVKGKTIENTVRLMANVESVSDSTAPRSIVVNEGTLEYEGKFNITEKVFTEVNHTQSFNFDFDSYGNYETSVLMGYNINDTFAVVGDINFVDNYDETVYRVGVQAKF